MQTIKRCTWCTQDPIYQHYHDFEWGRPIISEHALFELLCLEGQQTGLSWLTVLKKREAYRRHFFNLSIEKIAQISEGELKEKQQDPSLIRHFLKLKSIRDNAIAWLKLKKDQGCVSTWLWQWADSAPQHIDSHVTYTETSQQLATALKKYGFRFVGKTTCYAFMQASGMVSNHENDCTFRRNPSCLTTEYVLMLQNKQNSH